MSNYKVENDFMKNLKANEKRKLLRHIENAQNSSKKGNPPPVSSKGLNNVAPKPFKNVGPKPLVSSKSAQQFGSSSQSHMVGGVTKSVLAPGRKSASSNDVVVPRLNQDFVKMFNEKESVSSKYKPKEISQKSSSASDITNNKQFNLKSSVNNSPKLSSAASKPTTNFAKVNPVSVSARSSSFTSTETNSVPPRKQVDAGKKIFENNKNTGNNQSDPPARAFPVRQFVNKFEVNNGNKVKSDVLQEQRKSSNVKPISKINPPKPDQSSNSVQQAKPRSPPAVVSKPSPNIRLRSEPLSEKSQAKISPPTAVVSPIQDKSKEKNISTENKTNNEAARLRSISTPVSVAQPITNITYNAVTPSVTNPAVAPKNSVVAPETKMKRSMSEVTRVSTPLKEAKMKSKKLGHDFQPHELKDWLNWCDACGSVILSLFGKCLACTKCKMVCHSKCATSVSLTCEADQPSRSQTLTDSALHFYKTIVRETKDEASLKEYNTIQRVITIQEVQEKIEEFNRTVKGSQQMTLQEDGETFRGFIRVTMNLTRPVSVIDGSSKTSRKPPNHQRKASFYVDKGAMKALHLTSDTTAEQVVQALLLKYNITDNPMKFALFEKEVREEGHVILRKMLPRERPLFLRLLWGNGNSNKRGFTLQENESRDIHWESFSVAELHMFIKILDKEENDYILEIKRKYKHKAHDIKNAIEHRTKMAACS